MLLQILELFPCSDQFILEVQVGTPVNVTGCILLGDLILNGLQSFQLVLGCLYGLGQDLLLLRQQLRISRVKFQSTVYCFQVSL